MAEFIDGKNKWTVELNVGLIEDLKDKLNVDLDMLLEKPKEMAAHLFEHPKTLVGIMYMVCEDQITERKLTPRQFAKLFNRPTMDLAVNAFIEAIMTFYPRSSVGGVVREKLPTVLAEMDRQMKTEAERKFEEVLLNMRTDLPVS